MVSTVSIMTPPDRIPLEAVVRLFGPAAEFAPRKFAACIIKLCSTTSLLFASGKLVVVSAESIAHSLYTSQYIRLALERIPVLRGRTVFVQHFVYNVVGHGTVGRQLDLAALCKANPNIIWIHDSFPAAKCKVWLTPDCQCHCPVRVQPKKEEEDDNDDDDVALAAKRVKRLKKKKCPCTAKALIFKTGKVVIIGAQSPDDVYAVFDRLLEFGHDFASIVVQEKPVSTTAIGTIQMTNTRPTTIEEDIALLRACMARVKNKRFRVMPTRPSPLTPLMQLCEAGRVEQVRLTLAMEPNTNPAPALEYLESIKEEDRTDNHRTIQSMLQTLVQDEEK